MMRIGHGYDVHRLVEGRKLILGGVEIPWEKGLDGHSDRNGSAICETDFTRHVVGGRLLPAHLHGRSRRQL